MEWTASNNEAGSSVLHNIQTPQLYQPTTGINEKKPLESELQSDPIILHNINLLKYIQKWTPFSESLDSKSKNYEISGKSDNVLPLLNTVIEQPPMLKESQNKSPFLSGLSTQSFLNLPKDKMILDFKTLEPKSKLKFLQKSILVSCLNEGLINCDRHVLDTLTDLLDYFFMTISTQLASARHTRHAKLYDRQSSLEELASLQKILIDSGVGTTSDIVNFCDMNFRDRHKSLAKNADSIYKECTTWQEKMKKLFTPMVDSPSSLTNRITADSFSSPIEVNSSRRDGISLKRTADSLGPLLDEDIPGFFGHSEYVGSNPSHPLNPSKRTKHV